MARRREFDIDAALDAAVQCFWERGYARASVRDLCDAMGIGSGSFYASFGGKERCFRLALTRYLEGMGVRITPGPDAIRHWLEAIIRPERRLKGCMLVNSAIEFPALDSASRVQVAGRLQALEDFFWLCLKDRPRAREDAALLATTVFGVHVLVRSGAPQERLRTVVDRALAVL